LDQLINCTATSQFQASIFDFLSSTTQKELIQSLLLLSTIPDPGFGHWLRIQVSNLAFTRRYTFGGLPRIIGYVWWRLRRERGPMGFARK
jgi:hypothetical protein